MGMVWICFMVSRTLAHDKPEDINRELTLIFGNDFSARKVVWNEQMEKTGEYYLFVCCDKYWNHIDEIGKCHFITGVVPFMDAPHHFSLKDIEEFSLSVEKKEEDTHCIVSGDMVLVKDGYLKGLYGIVSKEAIRNKKCKVFFSFYVRQFSEILKVTSLEFICKLSESELFTEVVCNPIVIGAHVVHHHQLYRAEGRKSKI